MLLTSTGNNHQPRVSFHESMQSGGYVSLRIYTCPIQRMISILSYIVP